MPLVCAGQISGCLKMLGDQFRILIFLLDRGGYAPVQLRAVRFQLRLVSDGADQTGAGMRTRG